MRIPKCLSLLIIRRQTQIPLHPIAIPFQNPKISDSNSTMSLATKAIVTLAVTKPTNAGANGAASKPDGEARKLHPDFKTVESSRPPFDISSQFHYTQTPSPSWKPGSGSNSALTSETPHLQINPYAEGRTSVDNYKLLISGIVPRPIGFISTLNTSTNPPTENLAPFSYTMVVNHDPPIFVVGFSGGKGNPKDTCKNVLESGECVINIISEWFVEAANFCSVNAPSEVSEWDLSGLTPAPSTFVKPARVKESAFSIEAKLVTHHEWASPVTGKKTGVTCIFEGINFWVREDVVNKEGNMIDMEKLKPVSRLGGVSYARVLQGFELLRPDWEKVGKGEFERIQEEKKRENEDKGGVAL